MKSIWIKVTFLLMCFVGVAYAIYGLKKSDSLQQGINAVFNPNAPARGISWCETRVDEVELPNKFRMFQEGMKWFRSTPDGVTVELGFIPVEKWFAQYCNLGVEGITEGFLDEASQASSQMVARIGFIKGADKVFSITTDGLYTWDHYSFRSYVFPEALKALEELPQIGGSEKGKAPGH